MQVAFHLDYTVYTAVDDESVCIKEHLIVLSDFVGRLTVSFSNISTKISFFLSFLLSSYVMGFWIAVEEIELALKIFGMKDSFFFAGASVWMRIGSFTMKGRMASVVTSCGWP